MKKLFLLLLLSCTEEQVIEPKFCTDYVRLAQEAKAAGDQQTYQVYLDSARVSCRGVLSWGTKR